MTTQHEPGASAPTTDPATADAVAGELERVAVGAVGLTTRALAHADTGFELTFPQWRAILVVGEGGDGARIGEVAARLGATLPATSRLLRRLERRGITMLGTDEHDRRATRVRLTERGRTVRGAILAYRRAALREIALGLPDRDRRAMASGLQAIAGGLERYA
jgi:DNA-binding MarR family transcriptional regulator